MRDIEIWPTGRSVMLIELFFSHVFIIKLPFVQLFETVVGSQWVVSCRSGEEKEEEKWFHPRAFWANAADDLEADLRNHVKATRRSSVYSAQTVQDDKIVKLTGLKNCFHGIQHPGSRFHAWWDSFGMMLLAYDLVVIPLQVFEIGESVALKFLFWVAHVYWQLAILVSFVTGYEDAGIVIFSLKKTIKRYAFSCLTFIRIPWNLWIHSFLCLHVSISEHIGTYDMSSGDIPKRAVCWKPILKLAILRCFYTKYTYYILGTEHSRTFSQIYFGFSSPQNISNRTFWEPSLSSSQKPAKTGSDHNSYLGNLLAKVKLASSPKPYAKPSRMRDI